jgi:hypothetical protein
MDKSSSLKKDSTFSDCVAQGGAPKPLLFTIGFNVKFQLRTGLNLATAK